MFDLTIPEDSCLSALDKLMLDGFGKLQTTDALVWLGGRQS